eukprot:15467361-Alexandrium_andersonii.AAC.1
MAQALTARARGQDQSCDSLGLPRRRQKQSPPRLPALSTCPCLQLPTRSHVPAQVHLCLHARIWTECAGISVCIHACACHQAAIDRGGVCVQVPSECKFRLGPRVLRMLVYAVLAACMHVAECTTAFAQDRWCKNGCVLGICARVHRARAPKPAKDWQCPCVVAKATDALSTEAGAYEPINFSFSDLPRPDVTKMQPSAMW